MACADALVAPRPNKPTIAKPTMESLLTPAVILQLLCCLLRSSGNPTARAIVPGSQEFWIGHFVVTVSPTGNRPRGRARSLRQRAAPPILDRNPNGYNSLVRTPAEKHHDPKHPRGLF